VYGEDARDAGGEGVQELPLEKAAEGYKLMMDNKARYRVVLTMGQA
jgi:D-arabinose 1-dehydrogenase-like Zn-dependent alcohol dehydrogenase